MMNQDFETGQPVPDINTNAQFFESKTVRHNFIRKVYSLLASQLLITSVVVALFAVEGPVNLWAKANQWYYPVSLGVSFTLLLVITCCRSLSRKHPHNLILLFAFTVANSLMMSAITIRYETEAILMAAGLTLAITLALTLFAMQTKYDFTAKTGALLVILIVAMLVMIIGFLIKPSHLFVLIMSGVMALIMGMFIVVDTQMIIGGTHSLQLSPEDYVAATISLYLDIINMFLYILMMFDRR